MKPPAAVRSRPVVLALDEDENETQSVAQALRPAGYIVHRVHKPALAAAAIAALTPEVIVCDESFSDGPSLDDAIMDSYARLVVTTRGGRGQGGADARVTKPVDEDELRRVVAALLS